MEAQEREIKQRFVWGGGQNRKMSQHRGRRSETTAIAKTYTMISIQLK